MDEGQDLSSKTVVVLVVLTVLISVFGTFAVLNEASTIKQEIGVKTTGSAKGQVKLQILTPGDHPDTQQSLATGQVAFEILPNK